MIRFVEVLNKTDKNPRMERVASLEFELGEVWINEKYVVNVREHVGYNDLLKEGRLGVDLDPNHRFTTIIVNEGGNSSVHTVVGDPLTVANRLSRKNHQLLKG
tara:strand:- start:443 stop:751 length:309 start_codon:yes stop_codon:yes gene_type:complete